MTTFGDEGRTNEPFLSCIPLATRRYKKVAAVMRQHKCRSLLDAGANEGGLIYHLLSRSWQNFSPELLIAIDVDAMTLQTACRGAAIPGPLSQTALLNPCKVLFAQADLSLRPLAASASSSSSYSDLLRALMMKVGCGNATGGGVVDCIASIEVVEHLYSDDIAAYLWNLVVDIGPRLKAKTIILSTPNLDANRWWLYRDTEVRKKGDDDGNGNGGEAAPLRHPDHKFEWRADQFRVLVDYLMSAKAVKDYWCLSELFYLGPKMMTQGFVLTRRSNSTSSPCPMEEDATRFARFVANFPREVLEGIPSRQPLQQPAPPALIEVGWVEPEWRTLLGWIEEAVLSDLLLAGGASGEMALPDLIFTPHVMRLLDAVSHEAVCHALMQQLTRTDRDDLSRRKSVARNCISLLLTRLKSLSLTVNISAANEISCVLLRRNRENEDREEEGLDACATYSQAHRCTREGHFVALLDNCCESRRKKRRCAAADASAEASTIMNNEEEESAAATTSMVPAPPCEMCLMLVYATLLAAADENDDEDGGGGGDHVVLKRRSGGGGPIDAHHPQSFEEIVSAAMCCTVCAPISHLATNSQFSSDSGLGIE